MTGFVSAKATGLKGQIGGLQVPQCTSCTVEIDQCLLNANERAPDDNPSIGIILCAQKDDVEVEFALKSKTNPIGVAEYQLLPSLPQELKGKLPSATELGQAIGLPAKAATPPRRSV